MYPMKTEKIYYTPQWLQICVINHNIFVINKRLMGVKDDLICIFCIKEEETIIHLL